MKLVAALLAFASLTAAFDAAHGAEVQVAVAANFVGPMKLLAANFESASGHKVVMTAGATGKFYAQIRAGAPFDVFLSADDETPERLDRDSATVPGSRFTYAVGKLVLWSPRPDYVDGNGDVLRRNQFAHLAVAAPKLAPYGAAAVETLGKLGLLATLEPKFVQGESIGQTFSFVASGNAELGFVALSQVLEDGKLKSGSAWVVPAQLHRPIRQDAVILSAGRDNPAATALMAYLRSVPAQQLIRAFGYDLPGS